MQTTTQSSSRAFIPLHPVGAAGQGVAAAAPTRCTACHLSKLCLPGAMEEEDIRRLESLGFAPRRVHEGESLYRERDRFQFLYAVRGGTFKSSVILHDGQEQVNGFHMAGDMLGLDGLASGRYASHACALEEAQVCAIPFAPLAGLASAHPGIHRALTHLLAREIVREHQLMALLASTNADERVASFLLHVSRTLEARGYSGREFHLRMTRADIGSYLGMTLETVSRTLSAFQRQGLLAVAGKHVRITDREALRSAFDLPLR